MTDETLSVDLSLFLAPMQGEPWGVELAVPPPPPAPDPEGQPLRLLRDLGSSLMYLLSVFPEQWTEDLQPISWRICAGEFGAATEVAQQAVDRHEEYGRRVLGALREPPTDLLRQVSSLLSVLHRVAVRTDFLHPSCRVPFSDGELLARLMERHVAYPYRPRTLLALCLALWCWAPEDPPDAPWAALLQALQRKGLPNLSDVALAASGAALLREREPALAAPLMALATERYQRLAPWLDLEAGVFHDVDYSQKTPLDAYLEPLLVDALKRWGGPCWPGLCSRAARALPNLGDRSLNATLESLLHQRPIGRLPPLVPSRERPPGEQLAGADLAGADLKGRDLHLADLSGADLQGADLCGVDLEGADLSGANLKGAKLDGANLARADLEGACLERCSLEGATLEEACLKGARLSLATLRGAAMTKCDLTEARLDRAVLEGADLTMARAAYASFDRARMEKARLDHARLYAADLMEAKLSEGSLRSADLRRATLLGTIIEYADARKADLSNADLGGGSLLGSDLTGVSFHEAKLGGTWVNDKWRFRIRGYEGDPIWL